MQNAEIRKALTEEADTGLNIPMTTLNAEEGKEYARIMNQIQTCQDTAVLQFIMGTKSLDEFDSLRSDMKSWKSKQPYHTSRRRWKDIITDNLRIGIRIFADAAAGRKKTAAASGFLSDRGRSKFMPEKLIKDIKKYKYVYLMLIPVLAYYIIFCYVPMGAL